MSANPNLVQQMLERDLNAANELQRLLKKERDILKERRHAELSGIIDAKNTHLSLLDAHARERSSLLETLGLTPNAQGWQQLLEDHDALRELLPLWHQLQTSIGECKALNDVNGRMIHRSQQTLSQLVDLVRGKSGAPGLYNASGNATRSAASNTFAKV